MAGITEIPGELVARLSIMNAWSGCEDIEFYRHDGEGAVRYFRYVNNQEDQMEKIFTLNKSDYRKLVKILDFPEPVMKGEKMLVMDGIQYELTMFPEGATKTWSWWCDAPKGWEDVVKAANALLKTANVNDRVRIMRKGM